VTESGVPFTQQGRIGIDTAAYLNTESNRDSGSASFNIVATVPVADHTFIEAIMPLGIAFPWGNPTVGAHHVGRVSNGLWITAGGSFGFPLIEDNDFLGQAVPRALWNAHLYASETLPLQGRFGIEWHAGIVELRGQLEPSLWIPVGSNDDVHGAFYHAVELQLGHGIGGGLRVQGVAFGPGYGEPRGSRLRSDDDYYQFALSPFFAINRELGFLRLGLMLPIDEGLGPAFEKSWGFLFNTGLNID